MRPTLAFLIIGFGAKTLLFELRFDPPRIFLRGYFVNGFLLRFMVAGFLSVFP